MAASATQTVLRPQTLPLLLETTLKKLDYSEKLAFQNLKREGKYFEQTLFEHLNGC